MQETISRLTFEMQDAKATAEKCAEYIEHYTEQKRKAHQTYYRAKLELKTLKAKDNAE